MYYAALDIKCQPQLSILVSPLFQGN